MNMKTKLRHSFADRKSLMNSGYFQRGHQVVLDSGIVLLESLFPKPWSFSKIVRLVESYGISRSRILEMRECILDPGYLRTFVRIRPSPNPHSTDLHPPTKTWKPSQVKQIPKGFRVPRGYWKNRGNAEVLPQRRCV